MSSPDLLSAIVRTARAVFGAKAASITLYEADTDELVFHAVDGEGSDTLVGTRFPASEGIAGWTLQSREPLVVQDVGLDPRFAREVAESTGYVPKGLMAAPLLEEDRSLGVLSVLDRSTDRPLALDDMDLLDLLARQAAIAALLIERVRLADTPRDDAVAESLARVAAALEGLPRSHREAALRLTDAMAELLEGQSPAHRG